MQEVIIKELMIPISNYVTVKRSDTLVDVLQALESERQSNKRAHRDAVVVDSSGNFSGKVTMIDIFRALEPAYEKVLEGTSGGILTKDFVMKAVKEFNLWGDTELSICQRGGKKSVAEVMHTPESIEYLQETDTAEKALNLYVMGVHQPLVVKNGATVTGLLRFGDVFEVIRKALLSCEFNG